MVISRFIHCAPISGAVGMSFTVVMAVNIAMEVH